jgi:hypothetical protein
MPDETVIREFARHAIRSGKLPRRDPACTWAGPGVGWLCTICEKLITREQVEYVVEFARDRENPGRRAHLHLRCFAAWEFERTKSGE